MFCTFVTTAYFGLLTIDNDDDDDSVMTHLSKFAVWNTTLALFAVYYADDSFEDWCAQQTEQRAQGHGFIRCLRCAVLSAAAIP